MYLFPRVAELVYVAVYQTASFTGLGVRVPSRIIQQPFFEGCFFDPFFVHHARNLIYFRFYK